MEKALILGKMSHRVPRDILEQIKEIIGVTDASFIFGPYDFYVTVETATKSSVGDIVWRIRCLEGILDTITCYVVSFSDIRPAATGPLLE
jgi:hypothetical protein